MRRRRNHARIKVGALVVITVAAVSTPALPVAAAPSWSFVSSPNAFGAEISALNSVVCLTDANCVAVGDSEYWLSQSTTATRTLIEQWNGTTWAIVPSPSPGINSSLESVSCTAPGFCVAVGFRINYQRITTMTTIVETWNGTKWSMAPSPNTTDGWSQLLGVSCRTSRDCVAVGVHSAPDDLNRYTLVEHWDAKRWSIIPSPSPRRGSGLAGVSCTTNTACVAVGGTVDPVGAHPLAERWDGTKWSIVLDAVVPAIGPFSSLAAVKCTSNTNCIAVGNASSTLVEHWNGTTWSIVASPKRVGYGLMAVKCATASDCTAVGGGLAYNEQSGQHLIEHWNGTTWSIAASRVPTGTVTSFLAGLSCPARSQCMAVGQLGQATFVEHYSS